MSRSYTKVEELAAAVFERKAAGETNFQIAERYGLTKRQIEQLIDRQKRKQRKLEAGFVARPKGRPPKREKSPEEVQEREIRQLQMTVELLRNFLSEAGRR